MYKQLIQPYHGKMYQYVRNHFSQVKVFLHSCGAIAPLIPSLIDAGVDILNPVQISARGMNPFVLKKEYGRQIVFWGGGINTQHTLNNGSIDEIKNETCDMIDIFPPGRGYVFNQVHNIQANIIPEKILAVYDTALSYRAQCI